MIYANFSPTALYSGDFPRQTRAVVVAQGSNAAPVNGVATPAKRGTPLGRVTATDKYIPSVKTATDGSQVPTAVLAVDTDASAADVASKAYFTGQFAGEVMSIDASWTIATLEAAFRQAGTDIVIDSVGTVA